MVEKSPIQSSYDRVAGHYTRAFLDELCRKPFDRQMLDRFAQSIAQAGQVWDIGCGPGQVARYLSEGGLTISGLDLSEQMLVCARERHPEIPFQQGTMLQLPMADESVAGIVSFYAIIHLARTEVGKAMREFWRVLRPGGQLLLAFHKGQGELHNEEWFGEKVAVTVTLFTGEEMAQAVREAGFVVEDVLERSPYDFEYQTQRVYLRANKAGKY